MKSKSIRNSDLNRISPDYLKALQVPPSLDIMYKEVSRWLPMTVCVFKKCSKKDLYKSNKSI